MEARFTDAEFEKAYQDFLTNKATIHNTRARPDDESIWDALAEAQDSFFASPEGAVVDEFVSTTLKEIIRD
jgi:hypothetical protein